MQTERAVVMRRDLLSLIGAVSGSAAIYHAMTSLGFASDSGYKGPIKLNGDPKGTSVLILGAGLAGNGNLEASGYATGIVVNGQRGMPPFGAMMSDDQVAAVVNYVRTHFDNRYRDAVTIEDVRAVRR